MIDVRRVLLAPALLVVALASVTAAQSEQKKQSRPDVLFLAVDDMKDWVNCLGGYEGTVHTPNIGKRTVKCI